MIRTIILMIRKETLMLLKFLYSIQATNIKKNTGGCREIYTNVYKDVIKGDVVYSQ